MLRAAPACPRRGARPWAEACRPEAESTTPRSAPDPPVEAHSAEPALFRSNDRPEAEMILRTATVSAQRYGLLGGSRSQEPPARVASLPERQDHRLKSKQCNSGAMVARLSVRP